MKNLYGKFSEERAWTINKGDDKKYFYSTSLILLISTFALYWRTLKYSYVQDDWLFIDSIVRSGAFSVLKASVLQFDSLFYRPLGTFCMVVVYSQFGGNAVGFHLTGLLIHFGNSLLVALILLQITRHPIVSWTSAFLYMAAATIHIDPLMWMVGIYDLGATFFFLLTIYLFIGGRSWASVITFVLALLMKDSAIILPAILFIIMVGSEEGKFRVLTVARKLPHALIAALYLIARSGGWMKLFVAEHGSYTSGFSIAQLNSALAQYVQWCVESVISITPNAGIALLIFFLMIVLDVYYFRRTKTSITILFLFGGWLVVGLIPPMLIPSHTYRYYLSYSLPAFCAIFTFAVCGICTLTRIKEGIVLAVMFVIVATSYYSTFTLLSRLEDITSDNVRMVGSNNLMLKGTFVEPVQSYMRRSFNSMTARSTFIFDGIPAAAFGGSAGLRTWFGDTTLRAFQTSEEEKHIYLTDPMDPDDAGSDTIAFDPRITYILGWKNGAVGSFRLIDKFSTNPFSTK